MVDPLDKNYPLISDAELVRYALQFREELLNAIHNKKSSLSAILNPIHKIKPKEGFGVSVAIGIAKEYASAFRISKKGEINYLNRKYFSTPTDADKNDLFHLMAKNILAVSEMKKRAFPIGLSFAYPVEPIMQDKIIDGKLLSFAKGKVIYNLIGKRIGAEFRDFLREKYGLKTAVAAANDAICLLLGAQDAEIAGVVDEGLNFAYWEKRRQILSDLLKNYKRREIAVNLESKNFNRIKVTPVTAAMDEASGDSGYSLAEKESAGAYLYRIFNAGKNEIIGDFPRLSSSSQLNDILNRKFIFEENISQEQRINARKFAERIITRSAQIVAIELAGILLKLNKTKGLVPVKMEGNIFWEFKNYPATVNLYLNKILPKATILFSRIFGSSRRGIAILTKSKH